MSPLPPDEWSVGHLKLEVASLLDIPGYILMSDDEKAKDGLPVTEKEMQDFIRARREADAFLLDPKP